MAILVTAFISLSAMFSCAGGGTEQTSANTSQTVQKQEPAIDGTLLKDFTVVYPDTAETAKYRFAAEAFCSGVRSAFGVELRCRLITETPAKHEIVIGRSELRPESPKTECDYGFDKSSVTVRGGNVYIDGAHASGCYQGAKELLKRLSDSADGTIPACEFAAEGRVIKLACVGDSITEGTNSSDRENKTYPIYLQEMLGPDYYVLNAGLSGYSTCMTDTYAYWKCQQYADARSLCPDVIIYNLGTNDCNPSQPEKNWEGTGREELFTKSAHALIDTFLSVNPDVQIYICIPTSLFKVGDDGWNAVAWQALNERHSVPLCKKLAADYGFPTIDLYSWSKQHPEVFTDGLHPRDETYRDYAAFVYDSIKDTVKK